MTSASAGTVRELPTRPPAALPSAAVSPLAPQAAALADPVVAPALYAAVVEQRARMLAARRDRSGGPTSDQHPSPHVTDHSFSWRSNIIN
mgnify:CR=1 FL=1